MTGEGWVWFNGCPVGGDDGEVRDPGLPVYTPGLAKSSDVGDARGDGEVAVLFEEL